jgi:hypothetical protein
VVEFSGSLAPLSSIVLFSACKEFEVDCCVKIFSPPFLIERLLVEVLEVSLLSFSLFLIRIGIRFLLLFASVVVAGASVWGFCFLTFSLETVFRLLEALALSFESTEMFLLDTYSGFSCLRDSVSSWFSRFSSVRVIFFDLEVFALLGLEDFDRDSCFSSDLLVATLRLFVLLSGDFVVLVTSSGITFVFKIGITRAFWKPLLPLDVGDTFERDPLVSPSIRLLAVLVLAVLLAVLVVTVVESVDSGTTVVSSALYLEL